MPWALSAEVWASGDIVVTDQCAGLARLQTFNSELDGTPDDAS